MQTALVANLALAALCATPLLTPGLAAQDATDVFTTAAPRLREATPDKPMLGVMVSDTENGVLIAEVMEGSVAAGAGLQAGDLLLSLGGQRLDTYTDIGDVMGRLAPGDTLSITVVREGAGLVNLEGSLPKPEPPPAPAAPDAPDALADGHRGGFLGVELGEGHDGGVYVAGVIDNSAAWFAGLEAGDVLTRLDDTALDDNEDLVGAVSSKAPGTMISIAYLREGVASEAHVRLGQRLPMGLPGMPGAMAFPHAMGEGDAWFGELPEGGQWRFFGPGHEGGFPEIAVPHFKGHGGQGFELHGLEDLHEQLQELHEGLDLEWHDGQAHEMKIKIEDGKITIEKDGEVEVHDMGGAEGASGLRLRNGAGNQIGIFGADGQLKILDGADGKVIALDALAGLGECADAIAIECDMAAECADMAAECADVVAECAEMAAECADAAAECAAEKAECADAKAECEEIVEVELSDDDVL